MSLPKPSGDFEWVQESWGAALRCVPLAEIAPHCFSTRDLALEGVRENQHRGWEDLARAVGVDYPSLVRLRQVHGAGVFEVVGNPACSPYDNWPEADIAVSRDSSIALTVRTADCVPILLADRRNNAVAAVHAGWRGTAAAAVMVAVEALLRRFGSAPADLVAAVGPSIGPCCYEVKGDVIAQFAAHADAAGWFSTGSALRLDLWRATRDQLERAGLPSRQIHLSELCTAHHPVLFHSYRRDGNVAGRLVAAIRSSPGRKP